MRPPSNAPGHERSSGWRRPIVGLVSRRLLSYLIVKRVENLLKSHGTVAGSRVGQAMGECVHRK